MLMLGRSVVFAICELVLQQRMWDDCTGENIQNADKSLQIIFPLSMTGFSGC